MPSGDTAEGKAAQRARNKERRSSIADNGGPRPPKTFRGEPSPSWYAENLEPRAWDDIASEVELLGTAEVLVTSGSASSGGMTVQVQVLPAYVHEALDMVQRSSQGVLVCRFYQAPWELYRQDTAAWAHLSDDVDAIGMDD